MAELELHKQRVIEEVESFKDELLELALRLHDNPEIMFEEYQAVEWITELLRAEGFDPEVGVAGMDTAFRAVHRGTSSRPAVAILAEYDALPEIGHACGHNLIAGAAVGAAVALKRAIPEPPGTVFLLGTPAEEGGGGKVIMVEEGVFAEVDAALMFHPSRKNWFVRGGLASAKLKISFFGKPAHAASSPEKGINALDAIIQTFIGINSLRQHVTDDVRIHGIITHGGTAANVVPEFTESQFIVRAATRQHLEEVRKKVINCAEGAAVATGARVEFEPGVTYAERNNNLTMAGLFEENMKRFGIKKDKPPQQGGIGSSDIGNVSITIPAIHPYLKIADEDVAGHTPEFAEAARSDRGLEAMILAAKGLAMTTLDVLEKPGALTEIKAEFRESMKTGE